MTSSTTTIKAVSDGTGTAKRPAPRREDLAALRDHEAKTLIAPGLRGQPHNVSCRA